MIVHRVAGVAKRPERSGLVTWYGVGLLNPHGRVPKADDSLSLVGSNPTPGANSFT